MANLGLLSFLSGASLGAQARRKELEDTRRAKFMEKLEQGKADTAKEQGNRSLDISQGEADTRRDQGNRGLDIQEAGQRQQGSQFDRIFGAEYGNNGGNGLSININGQTFRIPNTRADMKMFLPFLSQREQDASAMGRTRAELSFRESHPDLYGSNRFESKLTPEQAAVYKLIEGIYGRPGYLGEAPGSRAEIADEGLGTLKQYLPSLFDSRDVTTPQDQGGLLNVFNQFTKENPQTFSSRRLATRGLQQFQMQHPMTWAQMSDADKQTILEYIHTLPEISDQDRAEYQGWINRGSPFTVSGR